MNKRTYKIDECFDIQINIETDCRGNMTSDKLRLNLFTNIPTVSADGPLTKSANVC